MGRTEAPFRNTGAPKLLKDWRKSAKLTQGQVADKLGYETSQFISNWERGVSIPPSNTIETLAKMYGVYEDIMRETVRDAYIRFSINKAYEEYK